MIRLTWLQFRTQAVTAAAALAAFAALLAITGPHLASTYAADGLDSCHGSSCPEHPRPARRLAPVQRTRQRRRAAGQHHPGRLHIGRRHQPEPGREPGRQPTGGDDGPRRLPRLPGQPGHPGGHHLPARQPLLALPVGRDRDLPRPRARPDRVLFPAAQPPPRLNTSAQQFTLAGITRIRCPVGTVPAWQDLYAAAGTASELVILTRIASMSKSEHPR